MRTEIGRVALSDLPPGAMTRLLRPPYHVLVVNVGGTVHALEDACPHSGVSLCDGLLEGERVTCSGHGWVIDVRSGRVLVPEGLDDVNPCFEVRIDGGFAVVLEPAR